MGAVNTPMPPFLELAAFIAVAATIGFALALSLLTGSLAGLLILRHAGGNHIARMRVVLDQGSFTALQADGSGNRVLLAGILLLIPGFISDLVALLLLLAPLRRAAIAAFGTNRAAAHDSGVVDLTSGQWHWVPDLSLSDRRGKNQKH